MDLFITLEWQVKQKVWFDACFGPKSFRKNLITTIQNDMLSKGAKFNIESLDKTVF